VFHPTPGRNGHQNCIKCTNADLQLRTPDDGQKGCPETCRVVIPIKLEFSASVGFIHKDSKYFFRILVEMKVLQFDCFIRKKENNPVLEIH